MSRSEFAWIHLVIAGLLEVAWAIGIKYTDGFSRLWPSVGTAAAIVASFYFLSQALRVIPVRTSYAIRTGIGAVGAAIVGMAVLGEPRTAARILSLLLILAGIVALEATSEPAS